MRIDLEEYARKLRVFDGLVPLEDERYASEGIHPQGPAHMHLEVQGASRRFRLNGDLDLSLELECCRCLRRFPYDPHLHFELLMAPQSDAPGEGEWPIEDQELEVSFYREPQLELEDLVQEQVFLVRPMKPICKPECRGLCPHCGADLNQGLCSCPTPEPSSPFAVLKRRSNN
ncbi:MAG TPA: DUF177 domain-containing protein [Acidobacteriota bacterium]